MYARCFFCIGMKNVGAKTFTPQKTSITQHLYSTSSLKLLYLETVSPGKSPEVFPVSHRVYQEKILHEFKNEHKGWP